MEALIILLHRSRLTENVNLSKFTAWWPDVLADKLHPQFDMKILSGLYANVYVGSAVASWLVRSSPDREVRV